MNYLVSKALNLETTAVREEKTSLPSTESELGRGHKHMHPFLYFPRGILG